MTVGCLIGLAIAVKMTHEKALQPVQEARRLLDSIGWAFILPQILATLGLLFTVAGVGTAISHLTQDIWRSITALSPWQSTLSVWRC